VRRSHPTTAAALAAAGLVLSALAAGCRREAGTDRAAAALGTGSFGATPRDAEGEPPREPTPAAAGPAGPLPAFREVGPESGFVFERYDDLRGLRRILEANGGGAAVTDFDADGRLDAFLTNGCRLPLKEDDGRTRSGLFRNLGGLRFREAADASGLLQHGYAYGCAAGDYDADGFDDLYVTALGPDAFWRNNGDGTFARPSGVLPNDVPQWGSGAAFADLNGDGHLDLYVANYLDESDESPKLCPNPDSPDGYEQCYPAMFSGVGDVLFLSDGRGGFIDATADAGLSGFRGKGLGVVVGDLDGDLRPEVFVANDGEANFLFTSPAGPAPAGPPEDSPNGRPLVPRFVERAPAAGVALNEVGYAQANMGIAAGDYDADGTYDLFLTHFFGDSDTLYANRGGLSFEDVTRASRVGPASRDRLGWGAAFFDADNDGWLDLFVANGHVDDRTWMSHSEPYRMRPQIYRNGRDGTLVDVSDRSGEYFRHAWLGRGVAVGDLDRDGRQDLVVSHQLAPSAMLRNETAAAGGGLTLRLVGTSSNRDGYGTVVEAVGTKPLQVRQLFGGGSFQSASAPELHLATRPDADLTVRITWPSGRSETHAKLSAGRWSAVEGRGIKKLSDVPAAPQPKGTP
jgi:hypothetical protein